MRKVLCSAGKALKRTSNRSS